MSDDAFDDSFIYLAPWNSDMSRRVVRIGHFTGSMTGDASWPESIRPLKIYWCVETMLLGVGRVCPPKRFMILCYLGENSEEEAVQKKAHAADYGAVGVS